MSTLVTRAGKGSPLTHNEVDANFNNLNTDKIQSGNTVAALTITSATINGGSISGITALPIASGGTGATTAAEAFSDLTPLTLTTASATPLVLTNTSGYQQQIIGSTNQTITLPSTATLAVGWSFLITNGTGFTVTVNTSTGANVYANSNIGSYRVWCISTANNNAASWSAGAETFSFETGTGSVVRASSPTLSGITSSGTTTITGTLALTGTTSASAQFATSQTTGFTTICSSQTSGTLIIGGASGTGTQTIGRSTVSQQTDIQAGATASGSTKTINIGTGGLAGSTTAITIGSTTGTSTTTLRGALNATGVATFSAGTASLPAITTTGDTNTGIFFPAADTIAFTEGGTESMRIDGSGNVGIGTTSPQSTVGVNVGLADIKGVVLQYNGEARGAFLLNPTTGEVRIGAINTTGAYFPTFYSNNAERMRIDSSGNVIVSGTSTASDEATYQYGGVFTSRRASSGGTTHANFYNGGNEVGSITSTTTATFYNTSSDYRLKENVTPMVGALNKVAQLKPCTYTWKLNGSAGQGFIAHELQEVVPNCVNGEKDAVDAKGKPVYQGVDTSFLVATLTAAIQELKTELDSVKTELQTLKGN